MPGGAGQTLRLWLLLAIALLLSACAPVRFNQMQQLGTDIMSFDPDPLCAELRGKVLTTREAAIGGAHTAAGGCGCN